MRERAGIEHTLRASCSPPLSDRLPPGLLASPLNRLTHDTAVQKFKQTTFSIVDLAGAERPEKALGTRITKDKAVLELYTYMRDPIGNDLSREAQGYLINFELTCLLSTVVAASDMAKQGKQFKPPNFGGSALNFFGGALSGESRVGALIWLSQSPQNGWETWFSMAQYGRQLAELKTRVIPVKTVPMEKAVQEAEAAAEQAASDLANAGTSPSAMKYAARRLGMKVYTEQRLHYVKKLKEMGIGVRAGGGAGAGSAAGAGAGVGAGGAETEG